MPRRSRRWSPQIASRPIRPTSFPGHVDNQPITPAEAIVEGEPDDWFTVPVRPPDGHIGDLLTLHRVTVTDIFGDDETVEPPEDWSLFKVRVLDNITLTLVPTVATPLVGDALEQVALGVDEGANLLFAVEERADGRHLASRTIEPPALHEPNFGDRVGYTYRPSTFVPHHWHPYIIEEDHPKRRFIQARLADDTGRKHGDVLEDDKEWLAPEPRARLLHDDRAHPPADPTHQISPSTVPVQGLRLDRRYVLGRRSDGGPVLWVQRRRLPLLSPPTSGLRFDVMEETTR